MVSLLAFIVALPTLYTLIAWAGTGYGDVSFTPVDRKAMILALVGAFFAAVGAPINYS